MRRIPEKTPLVCVHAHLRSGESRRVPAAAVRSITTTLVPHFGVDRIQAQLCDETTVMVEMLDPSNGHALNPAFARPQPASTNSVPAIAVNRSLCNSGS
jgi:hypothetical protein